MDKARRDQRPEASRTASSAPGAARIRSEQQGSARPGRAGPTEPPRGRRGGDSRSRPRGGAATPVGGPAAAGGGPPDEIDGEHLALVVEADALEVVEQPRLGRPESSGRVFEQGGRAWLQRSASSSSNPSACWSCCTRRLISAQAASGGSGRSPGRRGSARWPRGPRFPWTRPIRPAVPAIASAPAPAPARWEAPEGPQLECGLLRLRDGPGVEPRVRGTGKPGPVQQCLAVHVLRRTASTAERRTMAGKAWAAKRGRSDGGQGNRQRTRRRWSGRRAEEGSRRRCGARRGSCRIRPGRSARSSPEGPRRPAPSRTRRSTAAWT